MQTSLKLNSDTIMLIDNFVNKYFINKTNEQIQEIKKEAIEIANSLAKQNNENKETLKKELKEQLATKYDLKELETNIKDIEMSLKADIQNTRKEIIQAKYDFAK